MKAAFIIDTIEKIDIKTDSTYMMIKNAKIKNWQTYILFIQDIFSENGKAYGNARFIIVNKKIRPWYVLHNPKKIELKKFNVIFMRKDPPLDINYINVTYILSQAELEGSLIINSTQALRNINEKFYITKYLEFIPNTIITKSFNEINTFILKYKNVILKPLNESSGESIFHVKIGDHNKNVIIENITDNQKKFIMAQEYIKEIENGDKRILIINGQPLTYLASRIPHKDDFRGNVKKGAKTIIRKIKEKEFYIAKTIGSDLKEQGVIFAGIDIIGEKLTEVNISSPTMIQEIYKKSGIDASDMLIETINKKLCYKQKI